MLYRADEASADFYVVLDGEVEMLRPDHDGDVVVVAHGPGRFLGELNLLTGQRPYLTARMGRPGRVLVIPPAEFHRLMTPSRRSPTSSSTPSRRAATTSAPERRPGPCGSSDPGTRRGHDRARFAARSHVAHTWIDVEDADNVDVLLAGMGLSPADLPAVVTPTALLRRTTPAQLGEHLGLTFRSTPGYVFDLVVVGTGPAGLAASVYGASGGLDTVSVDAVAIGGQAGASSRIEYYVGFPNGISGDELTSRAAIQAQRLGARLNAPCQAAGLRPERGSRAHSRRRERGPGPGGDHRVGARYRRLGVDDLSRFEGAGVYYAATDLEARACGGEDVVVVGGGNSAGRAAIYLAQQGSRVRLAIRGHDLPKDMSRYLIDRIDADGRIEVLTTTEVRALSGQHHLASVALEYTPNAGQFLVPGCSASSVPNRPPRGSVTVWPSTLTDSSSLIVSSPRPCCIRRSEAGIRSRSRRR